MAAHVIHVELDISAPKEAVFARLSDHARFSDFPGIGASELQTPGTTDPNGTGAVRVLRATTGIRFVERIEAFEAPDFYRYRILSCTIPIRHIGGEVRLHGREGGTHVVWTSEFTLPLLGSFARKAGEQGFMAILKATKRELE